MILGIDIGNTTVEFGFIESIDSIKSFKVHTDYKKTEDEWFILLNEILILSDVKENIKASLISSVVPHITDRIKKAVERSIKKTYIVGKDISYPIKINYNRPEDVGTDRVVNAIAAINLYKLPVVVVDFGTAVTFDYINEKGEYEGGAIFPGLKSSVQALFKGTAKLPAVEIEATDNPVGKTTVDSIKSGIFNGYVSLVEGMVEKIKKKTGQKLNVVLTGGDAEIIGKGLSIPHQIDPFINMKGLYYIFKYLEKFNLNV